jgi:hypothetical protein
MGKTYLAWGLAFAFFSPILPAKPCGGFITQKIGHKTQVGIYYLLNTNYYIRYTSDE